LAQVGPAEQASGGRWRGRQERVLWEMRVADRGRDYCVRLTAAEERGEWFLVAEAGSVDEGGFVPCLSLEVGSDGVSGGDLGEADFATLDSAARGWYVVHVQVYNCAFAWPVVDELRWRGFLGQAEFGLGEFMRTLMVLWAKHVTDGRA